MKYKTLCSAFCFVSFCFLVDGGTEKFTDQKLVTQPLNCKPRDYNGFLSLEYLLQI